MKEKLRKAGTAVTWKVIFDNFNLPYKHVWKMNVETSNDRFRADVETVP
jgi:hypothetical protein